MKNWIHLLITYFLFWKKQRKHIASRPVLHDQAMEVRLFGNRILIAWLVMMLGFLVIVARLVFLQIVDHERYTTLSENNRIRLLPIPPVRGLIYDRNGNLLADNYTTFSMEVTPEQVSNLDERLQALGTIIELTEEDLEHFNHLRLRKRPFEATALRLNLTETEVARFSARQAFFPGFEIRTEQTRYYPQGSTGVHIIGYVGRINENELKNLESSEYSGLNYIGKTGVEKSYEDLLHGKAGYRQVETNVRGRLVRVMHEEPPVHGADLRLNIDLGLQHYAETLLETERAALVALEPQSGAVLALVSTPTYDPNLFVQGIDHDTYQTLLNSPDRPFYNRALHGQYPPGSTIKPFVGLAGLEYGLRTPKSRTWCRGWITLKEDENHRYRDWKRGGHGWMNLRHAMAQSCDVYFYELAYELGIDRLHRFMNRFNFGLKTHIDLENEADGLMPSRAWKQSVRGKAWYPGETLITGIGQGFMLVTPLQLAVATAILSTHGVHRQPRVAFAQEAQGGKSGQVIEAELLTPVTLQQADYWQSVIDSMVAVVESPMGTAQHISRGARYHFAGKTGTVQVVKIRQGERYNAKALAKRFHDHALFIAFAPVKNPRIAVSVVIENGGSGSKSAAPIARKIMDFYMQTIDSSQPLPAVFPHLGTE